MSISALSASPNYASLLQPDANTDEGKSSSRIDAINKRQGDEEAVAKKLQDALDQIRGKSASSQGVDNRTIGKGLARQRDADSQQALQQEQQAQISIQSLQYSQESLSISDKGIEYSSASVSLTQVQTAQGAISVYNVSLSRTSISFGGAGGTGSTVDASA